MHYQPMLKPLRLIEWNEYNPLLYVRVDRLISKQWKFILKTMTLLPTFVSNKIFVATDLECTQVCIHYNLDEYKDKINKNLF